jgi:hypothetical protein
MPKSLLTLILTAILIGCLVYIDSAEARGMPAVNLNLIPTAETLGKGGYSISTGMFPYDFLRSESTEVDVGGFFREEHDVRVESDVWLIPTRITYGLSERLDFTFGGTYSAGDTTKTVTDYYETGNENRERVYSQVVLEGLMGLKYKVKEAIGGLPTITVGGEAQMGYTVDTRFVDKTLENSFPFIAMLIHMNASYDFDIASIHGALGMYLSSKSIQASEKFDLPIQLGAEIPFDGFAAVLDITLFKAFSGIDFENIASLGLRYDISSNSTLNASVSSSPGFLIRLTVGGTKSVISAPPSAPTLF